MAPNYGQGRLALTPRTPRDSTSDNADTDPCAPVVGCCGFAGIGKVSGLDAFLGGGWSSLFLAEDMLDQMLLEEAVAESPGERVQLYLVVHTHSSAHPDGFVEVLLCLDDSTRAGQELELVAEAPAPVAYIPWYMLPLQRFTESTTPKSTVAIQEVELSPAPIKRSSSTSQRAGATSSRQLPPSQSPRILSMSLTSANVSPTVARVGDRVTARVVASGDVTKPRVLIPYTGQEIPMRSGSTPDALDGFERVSVSVKYDVDTGAACVALAVTAQVWEGQCTLGGADSEPDTAFRQPLDSEGEDEPPVSPSTQLTATVVGMRDRFGQAVCDFSSQRETGSSARSDGSELVMELSTPKILSISARSEAHHGMAASVGDTVCLRATFIEPVRAARFMISGRTLKATSLEVHVEAATVWGAKWVVEAGDLLQWGRPIPFGVHEFQDESRVWHCERLVGPLGEDPATGQYSSAVVYYDQAAYPGNYKGDVVETTTAWLRDVVGTSTVSLSPSSSLETPRDNGDQASGSSNSGSDSEEARPVRDTEERRAESLCQTLRDGVTLMGVIRKIRPSLLRGRMTPKGKGPGAKLVSRAESNIVHVLESLEALGLPAEGLFAPDDLLLMEDPMKVVRTLHQLGNLCFQLEGYVGPCVGALEAAVRLAAAARGNSPLTSPSKPRTPARQLNGFAIARAIVT